MRFSRDAVTYGLSTVPTALVADGLAAAFSFTRGLA